MRQPGWEIVNYHEPLQQADISPSRVRIDGRFATLATSIGCQCGQCCVGAYIARIGGEETLDFPRIRRGVGERADFRGGDRTRPLDVRHHVIFDGVADRTRPPTTTYEFDDIDDVLFRGFAATPPDSGVSSRARLTDPSLSPDSHKLIVRICTVATLSKSEC